MVISLSKILRIEVLKPKASVFKTPEATFAIFRGDFLNNFANAFKSPVDIENVFAVAVMLFNLTEEKKESKKKKYLVSPI